MAEHESARADEKWQIPKACKKNSATFWPVGSPVDRYLADQLVLPLGIAAWQTGRGGSFRTLSLTRHTSTHIELLRKFLEISISVETEEQGCMVKVGR
jgi:RNA 3'-terminal phosphate cyclase (ATP)